MKISGFEFIWQPNDGDVEWERRWETGLSMAARGAEEREAKRAAGLKSIAYTARPYTLEERAVLKSAIDEGLTTGLACAPFWGRGVELAANVTASSVVLVDNLWGFANGEYVFLFDRASRVWEVKQISGVAGSTLTLSSPVSRTYAAGTLVWPLIYGKLVCENWDAVANHRANPRLQIAENDPAFSKSETSCPVAATYLGRPIAPVSIDWSTAPRQSFHYDLNEMVAGFGKSDYAPTADYLVNGWEFTVLLKSATEIKAWDCLTASLPGRASGFWLQDALAIFRILSAPAADTVRVKDSGLAEAWASDPAAYVIFTKPGVASQIAKMTSVTDIGGGIEEVTLDTSLAGIDSSWEAHRLRYVRLGDDVERGTFWADQRQNRDLVLVELPKEYEAVEAAAAPLWLYTFWMVAPSGTVYWRHTSFAANQTSNGNSFTTLNLSHGDIPRSVQPETEEVEIDGFYEAGNIFATALNIPALPLWVQIDEATQGDPNATTTVFVGLLTKPNAPGGANGRRVTLKFASAIDALGAEFPNLELGPRCRVQLFGAGCELTEGFYNGVVTISTISADRRTITVTGGVVSGTNINGFDKTTDNYWAWGWLSIGTGADAQFASVLKSTTSGGVATLSLSRPLGAAISVGATGLLSPGCDRLKETCALKYNNYLNFIGQPFMPLGNPNIPPLEANFRSGTKK